LGVVNNPDGLSGLDSKAKALVETPMRVTVTAVTMIAVLREKSAPSLGNAAANSIGASFSFHIKIAIASGL
jgi:hypothetical protein